MYGILIIGIIIPVLWLTCTSKNMKLDEFNYTKEQLGFEPQPALGCALETWTERYAAYAEVLQARGQLRYYDEMLSYYLANRDEHWQLALVLNRMRGDIIYHAIGAYIWAGPIDYPADPAELLDRLMQDRYQKLCLLNPPSLQALVDTGILPHLPASPYPFEAWVDTFPAEPVQPGTVYYKPLPTPGEHGNIYDDPSLFENYALFVFDMAQDGDDPEIIKHYFRGDGSRLEEGLGQKLPHGIVYFEGIYLIYKPRDKQGK
jgi:hypothetical protein